MKIRAIGLLALTLTLAFAAGCAFEQQDDAVANAPGTPAATGGGSQAPTVGQGNAGVHVGVPNGNGHPVIPSTAAEPCDPDPQPWKPNCPLGPNSAATVRGPQWLTPPQ